MSRVSLVCSHQPFATMSRSGFCRRQCARMANVVMRRARFFGSRWCSAQESGFTLDEIRELFFGFRAATRPPKRWHELSERKIAELQLRMKRLKLMQTLLKQMQDCRCNALEDCGKKLLSKSSKERNHAHLR